MRSDTWTTVTVILAAILFSLWQPQEPLARTPVPAPVAGSIQDTARARVMTAPAAAAEVARPDPRCAALSCSSNGRCEAGAADAYCACDAGYTGAACELCAPGFARRDERCVTDCEALTNSCSGNGFCNGERCACDPGFAGADCSLALGK